MSLVSLAFVICALVSVVNAVDCTTFTNCSDCATGGLLFGCSWCTYSKQCVASSSSCSYKDCIVTNGTLCPQAPNNLCSKYLNCRECSTDQACAWCTYDSKCHQTYWDGDAKRFCSGDSCSYTECSRSDPSQCPINNDCHLYTSCHSCAADPACTWCAYDSKCHNANQQWNKDFCSIDTCSYTDCTSKTPDECPEVDACSMYTDCQTCAADPSCSWCMYDMKCKQGSRTFNKYPCSGYSCSYPDCLATDPKRCPYNNDCRQYKNCQSCTGDQTCIWCTYDNTCKFRDSYNNTCTGYSCSYTDCLRRDTPECPKTTLCSDYTTCKDCTSDNTCSWCTYDSKCKEANPKKGKNTCSGYSCSYPDCLMTSPTQCPTAPSCSSYLDCKMCLSDPACFWCKNSNKCSPHLQDGSHDMCTGYSCDSVIYNLLQCL